jgi:hypothetical protein
MTRAAVLLALLALACAGSVPSGIRPSRLSVRYDSTNDTMSGRSYGSGAGVELEFEFTYPEDPEPERRDREPAP